MKTIKLVLFSAVALLITTTSCIDDFTIRGNGIEGTEARITPGFDEVKSEGAFDVFITNGSEREVIISAESNILPYIAADVSEGRLRLHVRGLHNIRNQLPMEVHITMPMLDGVVQSGSGNISTGAFETNDFDIVLSGSGNIETAVVASTVDALVSGSGQIFLTGEADNSELTISGSGQINARDLSVRNCDAEISGSGNIRTDVEQHLSATISGSGNVYYTGFPAIDTHISGSGNVIDEN